MLETDTPANQLGGFSAIDYSGEGSRYFVLSDRGPGDGAASFACRVHEFDLQIDVKTKAIRPQLARTILLKNIGGVQLSGSLQAVNPSAKPGQSPAMDCEGLRVLNRKSLAVTDEYGPSVNLFGIDGKQQRQWQLPAEFRLCPQPNKQGAVGTYPNRGLEGLASLPVSPRMPRLGANFRVTSSGNILPVFHRELFSARCPTCDAMASARYCFPRPFGEPYTSGRLSIGFLDGSTRA